MTTVTSSRESISPQILHRIVHFHHCAHIKGGSTQEKKRAMRSGAESLELAPTALNQSALLSAPLRTVRAKPISPSLDTQGPRQDR